MKRTYIQSITVGIPTYEVGDSLIQTIHSIKSQSYQSAISSIIIIVDGNTISPKISRQLARMQIQIIEKQKREGQSTRINDLLRLCKTPFLILTNDDVIWSPRAVEFFIKRQEQTHADLMGARVLPLPPRTLMEHVIAIGSRISIRIAKQWNRGDNYLAFNGRLMMVSKAAATAISIPPHLWNNDAYMYFAVRQAGFITRFAPSAICWYQAPMKLPDYINQSIKFKASKKENTKQLGRDTAYLYRIPTLIKKDATTALIKKAPLVTILYIGLQLIVTIIASYRSIPHTPYWNTDTSTKKLQKYFRI